MIQLERISSPWNALFLCCILAVASCSRPQESHSPEILRIGVLPDVHVAELVAKYEPLVAYLSKELEQEVLLTLPSDYADLVRLFGSGKVDIAYFGGATFVSAEAQYQAKPLVMRDIDTRFTSYFLARYDAAENRIGDFEGQTIGFGSELSTSGHYMPRFFLRDQGIIPETFFGEVLYSGAHDRTVDLLLQGEIALAAVNSQVVNSMLHRRQIGESRIKIIWETPVYSDYVWATQPGWDQSYTDRVRNAFLLLSRTNERDAIILELLGTDGFVPATPGDFDRLRAIVLPSPGTDIQVEKQDH